MREDTAALSEIVGALMLILVVATASTGIALFVQSEQKQTQEQKQLSLDRELELLEFSGLVPVLDAVDPDQWDTFTVTLSSLHLKDSQLFELLINEQRVIDYTLYRLNRDTGTWDVDADFPDLVAPIEYPTLTAREQVKIEFDLPAATSPALSVYLTDALQVETLTVRGNHFVGVFSPPTAVSLPRVESVWNGVDYDHNVVLDGSLSDHPDGPEQIVKWEWTVDDGVTVDTYLGRIVRTFECDAASRDITLEVTARNGMISRDEILGHSC